MSEPVKVWGLPFAPLTLPQTVDAVAALVEGRRPAFVITANANYAMLTERTSGLQAINAQAALIVADGAPLVWASRLRGTPLPERVAGSDLIFALSERAAERGYRIFFLGGAEGVATEAARRLTERYPGLQVAGIAVPPHRPLTPAENEALIAEIRATGPDILLMALGQPKGEAWLAEHVEALGVPMTIQIGASLDFAAGRIRRAPVRLQKLGLEWAYRLWLEPFRLAPRYARNATFVLRMLGADAVSSLFRRSPAPRPVAESRPAST